MVRNTICVYTSGDTIQTLSLFYISTQGKQIVTCYFHDSNFITEVRIGFERESYLTSEPTGVQIVQEVCMVVFRGAVGRQLVIAVQWQPDTAQSEYIVYIPCTTGHLLVCFEFLAN